MKHLLLTYLLLTLFSFSSVQAQHTWVSKGLNPSFFSNAGLFKVSIDNTSGDVETGTMVSASLFHNGQKVAHQMGQVKSSSSFITEASIEVSDSRIDDPYSALMTLGFLPPGQYRLCIKIEGLAGQSCETFKSDNRRSTMYLRQTYPIDHASLNILNPMLTWNSTFAGVLPDVTYAVTVVENTQQNRRRLFASSAIPALFRAEALSSTSVAYPNTAQPLEYGQSYLWKVEAYSNGVFVGRSDVWMFDIRRPIKKDDYPIAKSYQDINEINDSPTFYIAESLKLKYISSKSQETFEMNVFDEKGKRVKLKQDALVFSRNEQYVDWQVDGNAPLKHLSKYRVELKGESFSKRFYVFYVNPLFIEE